MAIKVIEVVTGLINECSLWGDGGSPKAIVVLERIKDDQFGDFSFGATEMDGTWYKVTGVGSDCWQLCWSDRQQAYITIEDEHAVAKLEKAVGRE